MVRQGRSRRFPLLRGRSAVSGSGWFPLRSGHDLPVVIVAFRQLGHPGPNGPVNKRNLSTGENGEFAVESRAVGTQEGLMPIDVSN
jgi:hypothetical protein